jgi:hypothetical protein
LTRSESACGVMFIARAYAETQGDIDQAEEPAGGHPAARPSEQTFGVSGFWDFR